MDDKAKRKLTKARINLITYFPFFGTLALRLMYVEDRTIPTLAVDGVTIFYNPDYVNQYLDEDTAQTAIAHEIGHCIFDHIFRRMNRHPMKWNAAGDYVINGMLKKIGMKLRDSWLWKDGWNETVTAEYVYNQLPDPPPEGSGSGKGKGDSGDAYGGQDQQRDANTKLDPAVEENWKMAVASAALAAQQAGKMPAELERFVHDILHPAEDWRTRLRRFITEVTRNDYSWARPNKLFPTTGVYMPALHSESMGTLAVVIDDSGSIDSKILNVFGAETVSVRSAVRPQRTLLISCDACVNDVEDLDEYAPLEVSDIKIHGGGGTDFRPPFDWLAEQGVRPACLLYLTDGYGPFPEVPADFPVLWCITTQVEPPWGERVQITLD